MLKLIILTLLAGVYGFPGTEIHRYACPSIQVPPIFGIQLHTIDTALVHSYRTSTNATLSFCNVSVSYTHLGRGDDVHVTVWLPLNRWNGRLQGIGGSGYEMSVGAQGLAQAVAQGYAAAQTDGGHGLGDSANPAQWALLSPGNINLNLLDDFSSTTLNELAQIAKAVTTSFYNRQIKHTYWNGCSTGGRQGLMLAQRYPDAFDGILASAPLVHWPMTATATYWAQQVMREINYYPRSCELEAIRMAAIFACDELDGVRDGIIARPDLCGFDAGQAVGRQCCNNAKISQQAATIANAAWAGPRWNGRQLWHGFNKDANLMGVANTTCDQLGCRGSPFDIGEQWIRYFLAKDPGFDLDRMSTEEYARLFHESVQQYGSFLSTEDSDLRAFRARGGKLITVQGLADEVVPPNSTIDYYQSVLSMTDDVASFYRLFEAPGAGHCGLTGGAWPQETLKDLERWVEEGIAADTLEAMDMKGQTRILYPYI